jgi:hypothetical protein
VGAGVKTFTEQMFDGAFELVGEILHGAFKGWGGKMIRLTGVSARTVC